jgi:hypothetical protein
MARPTTPTDRIAAHLRQREAARTERDAAIQVAQDVYATGYPPALEQLLDDAAALIGMDERPPAPEPKPRRSRATPAPVAAPEVSPLSAEEVARLCALSIPEMSAAIRGLAAHQLDQLLGALTDDGPGTIARRATVAAARGAR